MQGAVMWRFGRACFQRLRLPFIQLDSCKAIISRAFYHDVRFPNNRLSSRGQLSFSENRSVKMAPTIALTMSPACSSGSAP